MNFSNPWHGDYIAHRNELRDRLMIVYPQMAKILEFCDRYFEPIDLIDAASLR